MKADAFAARYIRQLDATVWTDAPKPRDYLFVDDRSGMGIIVRGIVWQLIAEGGAGKTMSLLQCAIALACCEPWLGFLRPTRKARTLLLVAEEDEEEVKRRLYFCALAMGVDGSLIEDRDIVVCPLRGENVCLLQTDDKGNVAETPFAEGMRAYIDEQRFDLVVVDPLSRFAGDETETDNREGTRFVQALESLAKASGATIANAHHVNKTSSGGKKVDATSGRGSSSLKDGARAQFALTSQRLDDGSKVVTFTSTKQNYGADPAPIMLRPSNEHEGALLPLTEDERANLPWVQDADQALYESICQLYSGNPDAPELKSQVSLAEHLGKKSNALRHPLERLTRSGRIKGRSSREPRIEPREPQP